jgi:hypothetical protein
MTQSSTLHLVEVVWRYNDIEIVPERVFERYLQGSIPSKSQHEVIRVLRVHLCMGEVSMTDTYRLKAIKKIEDSEI